MDFTDSKYPATIGSFRLDKFEVTVGRFRNFVRAYPANKPKPQQGKSDHLVGDPGWSAEFPLPETREALIQSLECGPNATWVDDARGDETELLPVNCVNFYVAYAFCIWDGGRLPSEAEWNYAAAGGDQQRYYPWSVPPRDTKIDESLAVYGGTDIDIDLPEPVGSRSRRASGNTSGGDGAWGHADLGGNLSEWTLDYYADPYPSTACIDCLNNQIPAFIARVVRGGSHLSDHLGLRVARRSSSEPSDTDPWQGLRCARD